MTIEQLVSHATTLPFAMPALEVAAEAAGVTLDCAADEFATRVANSYLAGRISWLEADQAMDNLSTASVNADSYITGLAFDVYIAFDEGEYIHQGEDPSTDGEPRTRALLAELAGRLGA